LTKLLNYAKMACVHYCQLRRSFHAAFYPRKICCTGHD
jgi:hypothetical protein